MNFTIRHAELKDAPGIARVHVETWQTHYSGQVPDEYLIGLSIEKRKKEWTEILSNPKPTNLYLVAEEAGKIVGFCSVGPSRDQDASGDTGEIYAIYILPSKQGQGIGAALMDAGLNFLKEKSFKAAILWVLKTNNPTIKFYESKGWKADGHEKMEIIGNLPFEEIRYRTALE